MFYQAISIAGAVLILVAYAAHQLKRMGTDTVKYQMLNLIGGFFLCLTAIETRQYGFIMLEGSWTLLSAWALWKVMRGGAS